MSVSYSSLIRAGLGSAAAPPAPEPCRCPVCTGLRCLDRPNFFTGQLLTEAELNGEQAYVLAKNRLHNRYLHGWGVVCGLQVECNECAGWLTVRSGYAIDPCGNDVIVCDDQAFDLCGAIERCRAAQQRPPGDCDPLVPPNDPACDEAEQNWCVTLEYVETPARPLSTLRYRDPSTCGCGNGTGGCQCGGSGTPSSPTTVAGQNGNGGCGCGRSGGTATASVSTSPATRNVATSAQAAAAALGCEPTRTLEGFRLSVVCAPQPALGQKEGHARSAAASAARCRAEVDALLLKAPSVDDMPNATDDQLYSACCIFRAQVVRYFQTAATMRCELLGELAATTCPPPPQTTTAPADRREVAVGEGEVIEVAGASRAGLLVTPAQYRQQISDAIDALKTILARHLFDCICVALLPACGADPTEKRLVLACVTVEHDTNGKCRIVRVCNGEGRRQVMSFPTLEYLLAGQEFALLLPLLLGSLTGAYSQIYETLCCGDVTQLWRLAAAAHEKNALVTPHAAFAAAVANLAGADALSIVAPAGAPRFVDTASILGKRLDVAESALAGDEAVHTAAVDALPEEAVATGAAPTVVPADRPLTLLTRGNLVVGVAPADDTAALQTELVALRARVAELEKR